MTAAEEQVAGADSAKAGSKTEAMKEAENSADQSTTDGDKDGDHDDDDDNDDHTDNKVDDTDSDIILFPFFGPYVYQRLQGHAISRISFLSSEIRFNVFRT